MKIARGGLILAVAVLIIGVTAIWHGGKTPEGVVTIGVIAGTTGDYAAAGEAYVKGFNLALEEWNKSHSTQFSAVIEDDGFNAQKGVNAYTKLKSTDKPAAYAVLSSFTIDAIANDLVKERKPVALGFEQSTPAQDDNIFQVLPAARPVQEGLGKYLKELGYKKPVLFVSNNTPVYQNFAAGFIDGYGPDAIKVEVTADKTATRASATKALSYQPDVVVFFTDPPIGALLAKEVLQQAKNNPPKFAFDQSIQSGISDYMSVFGNTLNQLDDSLIALSRNDLSDSFKTAYKNKYGSEPSFGADMGYNAFVLLAQTYDADQKQWVKNMKSSKITGADGTLMFDAVGLRVPNTTFGTLEDGNVQLP